MKDELKPFQEAYNGMNESSIVSWEDLSTPVQQTALQIIKAVGLDPKKVGTNDIWEGVNGHIIMLILPSTKLYIKEMKNLTKVGGVRWIEMKPYNTMQARISIGF